MKPQAEAASQRRDLGCRPSPNNRDTRRRSAVWEEGWRDQGADSVSEGKGVSL